MTRKIIAMAVFATLAASGAFAQIGLGLSGAYYSDTNLTASETVNIFQEGEGIFYGPFAELGLGKLALGIAANVSAYDYDYFGNGDLYPMMEYDVNFYMQSHFLGYASFLDPFLELGLGGMGFDFADESVDPDLDNPLMASNYWHFGGGLGVNAGFIGAFFKVLYMFDLGAADMTYYENVDADGDGYFDTTSTEGTPYPLRRLKVLLGVKVNL
ncbi:MAG: hypothetical protein KBB32_08915 [Spirochaetia bacterium]|nr:hypothetical protein [Spirochaetia bacterium]